MSHRIIMSLASGGGTSLAAADSSTEGDLVWTPTHDLTPAQERRRIEWANEKIAQIMARLTAPAGHQDE